MEKLRPEQKKLWRKTYHQERDRGVEPSVAATRADDAVKAWEERGAFDDEDRAPLPFLRAFLLAGDRVCSWARITTGANGCTLFAGDVITSDDNREWLIAETNTHCDGDLVRIVYNNDIMLSLPSHGSAMRFDNPRPGCSSTAVYLGSKPSAHVIA